MVGGLSLSLKSNQTTKLTALPDFPQVFLRLIPDFSDFDDDDPLDGLTKQIISETHQDTT